MYKSTQKIIALFLAASSVFFIPLQSDALSRTPNDTYFDEQWYLRHIRADEAWVSTLGFEGVVVALIDSGIDRDHPDIAENIWRNPGEIEGNGIDDDNNGFIDDTHGWDFVDNDNDVRPDFVNEFSDVGINHGTIDAGIIAARGNNNRGIAGITWQTTIMPLRALDSKGQGHAADAVRAIEYAIANGASVINLSFAGPQDDEALRSVLRKAYNRGIFVAAAAGNAAPNASAIDLDVSPRFPVCSDFGSDENFIFGVAATNEKDERATFSNYGAGCVDGVAPGTRIVSTTLFRRGEPQFDNPYGGYFNGTSISAAVVAGTAALMRSVNPRLTPKQITHILADSSVKIDEKNPNLFGKLGRGRIDVARAVSFALGGQQKLEFRPPATASLVGNGEGKRFIVAVPRSNNKAEARIFTENGLFIRSFLAFPEGFRGGASIAIANFDGSKKSSIVFSAGAGGGPHVRIFDINTRPIGGFFAYDLAFRGGVNIAVGDLDGDGKDEIVTVPGKGGGPHVRIFSSRGQEIGSFFAFDEKVKSGLSVEVNDLNSDGKAEIIVTSLGVHGTRVFSGKGVLQHDIILSSEKNNNVKYPRVQNGESNNSLLKYIKNERSSLLFYAFHTSLSGGVNAVVTDILE